MKQTAPLRSYRLMDRPSGLTSTTEFRAGNIPAWIAPELATLTHTFFWDPNWAYEEKLDGERVLARKGARVILYSRNKQILNATYPEVVAALSAIPGQWWLDGEIAALDSRGISSFRALQQRLQVKDAAAAQHSGVRVYYYLFDIMHLDGQDTTGLPYRERRELLRSMIQPNSVLRHVANLPPRKESFTNACQQGREGLIVKNLDSTYQSRRTRDWLKFKCVNEQELVVVGYTDPRRSRIGFGALLLGYYSNRRLHYAGKVGTGFDNLTLRRMLEQMQPHQTTDKPVPEDVPAKGVHWLHPKLVAEVGFTEWTTAGRLRHPRFLGLRTDKAPEEVVRE